MNPVTDILVVNPVWILALVTTIFTALVFREQLVSKVRSRPRPFVWTFVYIGLFIVGRITSQQFGSVLSNFNTDVVGLVVVVTNKLATSVGGFIGVFESIAKLVGTVSNTLGGIP